MMRHRTESAANDLAFASVIVPVFNDAQRLGLCLQALQQQTYAQDRYEIIVVDNGSQESPKRIVDRFAGCTLLNEHQPGSYAARNRGVFRAKGSVLAFTDADCIPQPDWLEQLVAHLTGGDNCQVVGGRIAIFPAREHAPCAIELYDCVFGLVQKDNVEIGHHAATANMATRREVFDRVGPFNTQLKSGGDVEWGHRAHEAGSTLCYVDEAVVQHTARSTWGDILSQARRHAGGRHELHVQRNYNYFSWRFLRAVWGRFVPSLSDFARARRHPQVETFSQWVGVCAVLVGVQYTHIYERLRILIGGRARRQ